MKTFFLRLNNWLVRRKKFRLSPLSIILLGPRCLQNSDCVRRIVNDPKECQGCGRCDVAALVRLSSDLEVGLAFVTGGEMALRLARRPGVSAVVAMACPRELILGLLRKGKKPVLVVPIERPCGPCRDTRVNLGEVEEALRFFLAA